MKLFQLTALIILTIVMQAHASNVGIPIKPGWNGICVPVKISQQDISTYVNSDQVVEIKALVNGKWVYYRNQADDELTQFIYKY